MVRALKVSILIFAGVYFILAIVGGFLSYSPVPFWDMWNGYLEFYARASEGDWSAWWEQHNEHRIVLSRILFWIDNEIFGGRMIFLIVVNYILILIACVTYKNIIATAFKDQPRQLYAMFSLVAISLLFSWTQSENITWGFQSQFFLAQLLPLIAFYLLFESKQRSSNILFAASSIVGWLACVSMANGVTALPVAVLLAIALRLSFIKIAILTILSIASISLYFYNYVPPAHHGSLGTALIVQPFDVVEYVLLYLGAPLFYMAGKGLGSHLIAQLGGLLLIASSAYFLIQTLRGEQRTNIKLVLLAFLLFIGGSALATAGGRVVFGIDQALAGRYMTPVLMAWIALALLYADHITRLFNKKPVIVIGGLLLIQLLLLPAQLRAVNSHKDTYFERMMAALALEIGADDKKKIEAIFPSYQAAKNFSKIPVEKNISIFGHPLIEDVRERLGSDFQEVPSTICQGALDEVNVIHNENNFMSIRGWIFDPVLLKSPERAFLVNMKQQIIGTVLLGAHRPDVKTAINEKAEYAGFEGYAFSSIQQDGLKMVTNNCYLPLSLPELPYEIRSEAFGSNLNTLSTESVVDAGTWTGADYYRSEHEALNVFGSFITSDSNTGYIKLKASKGDSLYYRTGPSNKGQFLRIGENVYNLPLSTEWILLTFSRDSDDLKEVIFEDAGSDWGQWSAVAIKK